MNLTIINERKKLFQHCNSNYFRFQPMFKKLKKIYFTYRKSKNSSAIVAGFFWSMIIQFVGTLFICHFQKLRGIGEKKEHHDLIRHIPSKTCFSLIWV